MGAGGDGGQAVASWISDQVRGSRGEEEGNLQLSRRGVSAPGAKPPRQYFIYLFNFWRREGGLVVSLGRRRDLWLLVLDRTVFPASVSPAWLLELRTPERPSITGSPGLEWFHSVTSPEWISSLS